MTQLRYPELLCITKRFLKHTGCSLNIVFSPLNVVIFLNCASSAAALVFYLPFSGPSMKSGVHIEEKPKYTYIEIFEKTQFLMNTLYMSKLV